MQNFHAEEKKTSQVHLDSRIVKHIFFYQKKKQFYQTRLLYSS